MKEMVSLAEVMPETEPESWLADVAVYPAGEKQVLVHARSTGATCFLHAAYGELLTQCREFKSLDEHLSAFDQEKRLSGMPLSAEAVQVLRHKLQQLAQKGYLIPHSQIRSLFQKTEELAPSSNITSIGFLTCNRVETLQGTLIGYLENCQRFGRSPEFVVVDDSPSPSTREAYREMLRDLKKRYGMKIAYAGLEEKTAFVRKLSEVGKIPEEVVSWACIGDKTYGEGTIGANRNALLLHTVGECFFLSDDDLICRVAASPGFQEGLALHSQGNPSQYWYYPDRERALEATPPAEQDILALHEQWLGQDPRVAGAPNCHAGQLSVERAEPEFLRRLATQPGKIILAAHGVIGDASFKTIDYLFPHPDESLTRQTSSEEAYHSARTSREVAQVVNQLTLTANPYPLIGMYIGGLDNRELLPPFTPVGGAEDYAFGAMLSTCFPDAYAVYLPWVLLHTPPEARSYAEPIFHIQFYDWLPKGIALFHPDQVGTPADLLPQLGQFLERLGRRPTPAFEELTRQLLWQDDKATISLLEKRLHEDGLLASWKRDAEAHCVRVQQSMLLPIKQRLQEGTEITQRAIVQFAQILQWWPAMVETARGLRADGIRVAQPL